jgi:outer membrane receptor protein involved in Fe transport
MGGTVKLISNPADPSGMAASVQALVGSTKGGDTSYGANGMLNVPLVKDRAALRVVAGFQDYAGWIDRVVIAEPSFPHPAPGDARGDLANAPVGERHGNDNTTRVETARVSLAFKATDNFTITPRVMYERIKQDMPDAYDSPPGSSVVYQPFDIRSSFTDTLKLAGLNLDAQVGDINITSISSVWERKTLKQSDVSEGLSDLYGVPSYYATDGLGFGALSPTDVGKGTQFSQEVRLTSTGPGNLSWLVGGFYARYHYVDEAVLSSPAFTAFTAYGPGFFYTDLFFDFKTTNTIKQKAAFANITYALPHNFELRAGARYYKYDTEFDLAASGAAVIATPVTVLSNASSSEDGVSPSITLSYRPTGDFTGYATMARGFRPGGGNFPITETGPTGDACRAALTVLGLDGAPPSYKSDLVTSFELGEKLRVLDQRITFNAAAYLLKWDNVQQPVVLGGGCGSNFVQNAANAQIKGAEAEIRATLLPGFTFSASASYNDAKFVEDNLAAKVKDGDLLAEVPKWTTTEALEYRRAVANGSVFVRASQQNMDRRPAPSGSIPAVLPSQSTTNLRLGWVADRYSVNFSVTNVFDEVFDAGNRGTVCCGIPNGYRLISTNRPRTFGVDISTQF